MKQRFCKICGTQYEYCPTCSRDMNKPKWYTSFDKVECKNLFDALSSNGSGSLSDEETLEALRMMNYKSMKITNQGVLNHIHRIENSHSTTISNLSSSAVPMTDNQAVEVLETELAREAKTEEEAKEEVKEEVVEEAVVTSSEAVEGVKDDTASQPVNNFLTSSKKNKNKNKFEGNNQMPTIFGYAEKDSSVG